MSVDHAWLGNRMLLPFSSRYGNLRDSLAGAERDGSGQHGRMPMSPISLDTL